MSILGNPITLGGGGANLNIDFGATPETNCQGLFNQIHKKATKKCQKQILAPDTFADGLFAPA